jgi:hypothetical protein
MLSGIKNRPDLVHPHTAPSEVFLTDKYLGIVMEYAAGVYGHVEYEAQKEGLHENEAGSSSSWSLDWSPPSWCAPG